MPPKDLRSRYDAPIDEWDLTATSIGMQGVNVEMDDGRYDPQADDGEGEGENNAQDRYRRFHHTRDAGSLHDF